MMLDRLLLRAGLLAALGLGLAAPVALADQGQCEAECVSGASTNMQTCLERCPEARDPTKASSFQACALRCKSHFDDAMKQCSDRCPSKDPNSAQGKKKKKGPR